MELAKGWTIQNYHQWKGLQLAQRSQQRDGIADRIEQRLLERYILPLESVPKESKNGFTMMAVCSLLIETYMCFRRGRDDSRNCGGELFEIFFLTEPQFTEMRNHGRAFYANVRCGLLHQAETKAGWKILRTGVLFRDEAGHKTINATRFLNRMRMTLRAYANELKNSDLNSELWRNAIRKLDHIVDNCTP